MTLDDFTDKAVKELMGGKELKVENDLENKAKNNIFAENNIVPHRIFEDQSADNKSVKVVSINPDKIIDDSGNAIDLNNTSKLRNWLLEKYRGREVKVQDDGKTISFFRSGIEASVKKRGEAQRQMYADLDSLIENGVYIGYELGDAKHKNIDKQNIYYSAAKIGDKIYGVRFKIDIFKGVENGQYKDHKIVDLEIEKSPLPYAGFDPYRQSGDIKIAIPNIKQAFSDKDTNISDKNKENNNNFFEPRNVRFFG